MEAWAPSLACGATRSLAKPSKLRSDVAACSASLEGEAAAMVERDLPDVTVRVGRHAHERRLRIRAEERPAGPEGHDASVWGVRSTAELVEIYASAVRDGVPKLSRAEDAGRARVVARVPDGTRWISVELFVPPTTHEELRPLVTILQTALMTGGALDVELEELDAQPLGGLVDAGVPRSLGDLPFELDDRATGAMVKHPVLRIVFERELTDQGRDDLERWFGAWLRLVGAGAFMVEEEQTPSFGLLEEVVDAYPDEWVAKLSMLAIDADATALLMERLIDLHATDPITLVELG